MAALLSSFSVLSSRSNIFQRPQMTNRTRTPAMRVHRSNFAVTMATATKAAEFRNLSNEQIDEKVRKLKAELFGMRIKFAKREEYKPAQYQETRKNIARLLTIKREREVAEGVSRRESLRAERRKLVDAGLGNF